MKNGTWGKLFEQLVEEGIRIAEEVEKDWGRQAEKMAQATPKPEPAKASEPTRPQPASSRTQSSAGVSGGNALQTYVVENLRFQGYETVQDISPTLVHVFERSVPVAHLAFSNDRVWVEHAVKNGESNQAEAFLAIERLKQELLTALQTERSNEVIKEIALALTDAFAGEAVAKEDAQAFDKLVDTLNTLLVVTEGVH